MAFPTRREPSTDAPGHRVPPAELHATGDAWPVPGTTRPTMCLLIAPSTQLPSVALLHSIGQALRTIEPSAQIQAMTDTTRHQGSGYRLTGPWVHPLAAHALLIQVISGLAFSEEPLHDHRTDHS